MSRKNVYHLKAHLLMYEPEYPIQKGYIARLLIVEGRSVAKVLREARRIVYIEEPGQDVHKRSFFAKAYRFKNRIVKKSQRLTKEWPSLVRLFLQPFPITLIGLPVAPGSQQPEQKPFFYHTQSMGLTKTSIYAANSIKHTSLNVTVLPGIIKLEPDCDEYTEVRPWDVAYDKEEKVHSLGDMPLASGLNGIDTYVSSLSPSHNTYTSTDVEGNKTVAYNTHSSVTIRDKALSESNHQVIDSVNLTEDMCYSEDVQSGEDGNIQTYNESDLIIGCQVTIADVKDGPKEYSKNLHQEQNQLLEEEFPACKKTSRCQQTEAKTVIYSREYLNEILANKWKTKTVASQKSYQQSILQSVQPSVLQSVQPSVLQSVQPSVLQSVQPSVLQSVQPSVLQSAQVTVVQSYNCKLCDHGLTQNNSQRVTRHTWDKPYKCSVCGQLDTVHIIKLTEKEHCESTQLDDRCYKCDLCGRTYKRYFLLKKHRLNHIRDRHYKCNVCGRKYAHNSVLKIHEKTHSSVKLYKFGNLSHKFALNSYLKQHAKNTRRLCS